ncbi:MAG: YgjV family protein [Halobacteriovoraceae bacterium]|nr:YgjV family protein [Halobacteriovoraceae bacterium]
MVWSNVEAVGYLASVLLMISFSLKDVKKLRTVNSLGCFCFIVYGFLLQTSWPIIITNAFILGTNVYYLFLKKENQNS